MSEQRDAYNYARECIWRGTRIEDAIAELRRQWVELLREEAERIAKDSGRQS